MSKVNLFLNETCIQAMRDTFKTKQGLLALDMILQLSGIWDVESAGPKSEGRKEMGAEIIQLLGVDDLTRSGAVMSAMTDGIMNSLMKIPITTKKKEEEKKR